MVLCGFSVVFYGYFVGFLWVFYSFFLVFHIFLGGGVITPRRGSFFLCKLTWGTL